MLTAYADALVTMYVSVLFGHNDRFINIFTDGNVGIPLKPRLGKCAKIVFAVLT